MKARLLEWIKSLQVPAGQGAMVMPMLSMVLANMSDAEVEDMVRQLRAALAALDEC